MAKESGHIISECSRGEVRSIAVHFPSRSKKHRVTSVPPAKNDLAQILLEHIRAMPDRYDVSVESLRERCVAKKKEVAFQGHVQTAAAIPLQDCRVCFLIGMSIKAATSVEVADLGAHWWCEVRVAF